MPNQVRIGTQVTGVGKASSDLDNLKDKFAKMQAQGAKGFAIGVGAAATTFALGALQQAASSVGEVLGEANKAYAEEEASVSKLGTSLRANIPAWTGNTDAIESVIKSQMRLGFSDEEQRNSLALLVAATHDVAKAQQIQAVAMDLARFKGISLADATDALTKVEAGSFRILKSLGIELKKGATQTDALAAVEGVAAGQAEDYAKTNEGKLLVSQVKVNEAMERFGKVTLPLTVKATEVGADAVSNLAEAFSLLTDGLAKNGDEQRQQITSTLDLVASLGLVIPGVKNIRASFEDTFPVAVALLGSATDATDKSAYHTGSLVNALDKVPPAAKRVGAEIETQAKSSSFWFGKFKDDAIKDANDLIAKAFDPAIEADKLLATNAQISAQKRILASGSASKAEKADARATLHQLDKDQAQYLLDLASTGDTTSKQFQDGLKNLKNEIKNSTGPTHDALVKILNDILNIKAAGKNIAINFRPDKFDPKGGRATGGPVSANDVYMVGEHGPEWFVSDKAGKILPHGTSPASTRGGSSGGGTSGGGSASAAFTFNLTVNAAPGMTPGQARALSDALMPAIVAGLQRNRLLPRTGTGLTG